MNLPAVLTRRAIVRAAFSPIAIPLLEGLESPPDFGVSALVDGTGMAQIPAGEFLMGSPNGNPDEQPVHRVRITRPFEMSKFEITQAQWDIVMRKSACESIHPDNSESLQRSRPARRKHFVG